MRMFHILASDIDECNLNTTCDQLCDNIPGGFICSCEVGYKLAVDGLACEGM